MEMGRHCYDDKTRNDENLVEYYIEVMAARRLDRYRSKNMRVSCEVNKAGVNSEAR